MLLCMGSVIATDADEEPHNIRNVITAEQPNFDMLAKDSTFTEVKFSIS